MKLKRPTIECTRTLLSALRDGQTLGRAEVVAMGLLSGDEFARARKMLLKEGLICCSTVSGRRMDAKYTLTGDTPKSGRKLSLHSRHEPVQPDFERLLLVWKIELPAAPTMLPTIKRVRFSREDSGNEYAAAGEVVHAVEAEHLRS